MKQPFYKSPWFWVCMLLCALWVYKVVRTHQQTGDWLAYINYDGSIKHITTPQGQDRAIVRVQQVPVAVFDKNKEDSFINALNNEVKAKDLLEATLAKIRKADTGVHTRLKDTAVVHGADTQRWQHFEYEEKYLSLSGELRNNDLSLSYSISTPFTTVHKWKRPHWWKPKELILEITPEDPHAVVDTVRTIVIQQPRPKRWSVGPFIGYGYNGDKWAPVVGGAVQLTLFKF